MANKKQQEADWDRFYSNGSGIKVVKGPNLSALKTVKRSKPKGGKK